MRLLGDDEALAACSTLRDGTPGAGHSQRHRQENRLAVEVASLPLLLPLALAVVVAGGARGRAPARLRRAHGRRRLPRVELRPAVGAGRRRPPRSRSARPARRRPRRAALAARRPRAQHSDRGWRCSRYVVLVATTVLAPTGMHLRCASSRRWACRWTGVLRGRRRQAAMVTGEGDLAYVPISSRAPLPYSLRGSPPQGLGPLLLVATLGGLVAAGWPPAASPHGCGAGWSRSCCGRGREALLVAAVAAAVFLLFLVARAFNPAIFWGEKPMDFSFLNAFLRASSWPPGEPWMAGMPLHYYYFGQVLSSFPILVSGCHPGGRLQPDGGLDPGAGRGAARAARPRARSPPARGRGAAAAARAADRQPGLAAAARAGAQRPVVRPLVGDVAGGPGLRHRRVPAVDLAVRRSPRPLHRPARAAPHPALGLAGGDPARLALAHGRGDVRGRCRGAGGDQPVGHLRGRGNARDRHRGGGEEQQVRGLLRLAVAGAASVAAALPYVVELLAGIGAGAGGRGLF